MTDINQVLEPYYNQFEKLFTLREAYGIEFKFVKKALKTFMKQYLYDLRHICKIRRRLAHKRYKQELDELLAKAEETAIQAVEVVKNAVEADEPTKELASAEEEPNEKSKELVSVEESKEVAVAEEEPQEASKEADEVEDLTDS